jgi:hypothetical protein
MTVIPKVDWYYSETEDTYNYAPWTEMDIEDLREALANGWTIERVA